MTALLSIVYILFWLADMGLAGAGSGEPAITELIHKTLRDIALGKVNPDSIDFIHCDPVIQRAGR
jgi:hypothetical protein